MTPGFIVTATDTDVGKTVFAAALAQALHGYYWKPVQAGFSDGTDSETVARLSGLPPERILPEAYRLRLPASPHLAAAAEDIKIDPDALQPPGCDAPLIIEGAGGVLVPLSKDRLFADVFARWGIPVILCARTRIGTINHCLLSIEALRARRIPVHGIAFIGNADEAVEATITTLSGAKRLGRLPHLAPLDSQTLALAFRDHFRLEDFAA